MEPNKAIVIDGKGHVVGRLAATVAKQLLEGSRVVVLRAEEMVFSMPLERATKIYEDKLKKRCLVNPKKGPFHYKEPSKNFRRVVRGMMKYKTQKGREAFERLKVFDGIPLEHEGAERVQCVHALAETRLKPYSKSCTLGQLCEKMGWNNFGLLKKFEAARQARADEAARKKEDEQRRREEVLNSETFKKELEALISRIE